MELYRYLEIIWRRLWVILLLVVVGAGASYYYSLQQPVLYSTTTTLLINPSQPNQAIAYISTIGTVERLAASYTEYMKTRAFTGLVIEKLGLKASSWDLAAAIRTELVANTNTFKISIVWGSPQEAERIANGIADIFITENLRIQQPDAGAQTAQSKLQQSLQFYEARVEQLRQQREEVESSTTLTESEKQSELSKIQEALSPLEDTYIKLVAAAATTKSSEQSGLNTATVVDRAPLPGRPISPNTSQNVLLATIAALLVGLGLAFLLEYMDYTVKSPADVEMTIGSPPLGQIGVIPRTGGTQDGRANMLVTAVHPKSPISEAFRGLRTNIQFLGMDKSVKSIVVTSAIPLEGKTLVASNLAVVLAQSGKRVILVDADLRRPAVHKQFGLSNERGFTNLIVGDGMPGGASAIQSTSVENLRVVTSGPLPANPSELLGSAKAEGVVKQLAGLADFVIYDTPPMGPLTDAVVLSRRTDGVLMVVRAGKARRDVLAASASNLGKVGTHLLGTVLNMVRPGALGSYSYYYHYYYSQYGEKDDGATGEGRRGKKADATTLPSPSADNPE